ncbi:MAG: energy transducer TonB [Candidatus Mariimomonas ferrooxydans]
MSSGIIEIIKNSIERAKTYPLPAKKRGIQGTVYVSFRISPQGEPQYLKILKSSGSSILDTATLDIVKKAAPFPYVDIPVEVPVVFRLN